MSILSKTEQVLAAARDVFARYGYRRTTMADLARAAGMSRPALYLLFANKEAIFRALADAQMRGALARAEAALALPGPLAEVIEAAILAKDLELFRLLAASPHGAEILAESSALTADLHATLEADFAAALARRLAAAGVQRSEATARMLAAAATGLKHAARDEARYRADVACLAGVVAAGLSAG